MAKWGEGDPRWIVEERPDATNVNNWHWTEKNATPWSQEKIKELFKNLMIPSDEADLKILEVDKCDGEASANNRKGKLIFFYEWNVVLKWEGTLKDGTERKFNGNITIPNLSEENEVGDLDVQTTVKDSDEEGQKLRDIMHKCGKEVVREKLGQYIAGLKVEFSKGMILPRKDEVKPDAVKTLASGFNKKISMNPIVENNKQVGTKIETGIIKTKKSFTCSPEDFYNAMTKMEMVIAFTGGPVKMEAEKEGKFELFNGNITGSFVELVPGEKIVQQWRYKQWPSGHHSTVTLDIKKMEDRTDVNFIQTGVPKSEIEVVKENWNRYYWNSMNRVFGFGSCLS